MQINFKRRSNFFKELKTNFNPQYNKGGFLKVITFLRVTTFFSSYSYSQSLQSFFLLSFLRLRFPLLIPSVYKSIPLTTINSSKETFPLSTISTLNPRHFIFSLTASNPVIEEISTRIFPPGLR